MKNDWCPLTPAEWVALIRPRPDRELAREVWDEEFTRARLGGFEPEKAAEMASAEVRLVLRRLDQPKHQNTPHRRPEAIPVGGTIVYDPGRDRYVRIGDADDQTAEATPFDPAREAEVNRMREAESDFAGVVESETGLSVEENEWRERMEERRELVRQSHQIANKLECGGTQAYRCDEYQLYIWSVFSRHVEQVPAFRRICFLPSVAAMVRAQKLASLEFFLDRHPFCRFWTFTSGARVALPELRARIESLHKRLNALNKELRRRYGVEMVFRSTELGTVETAASAGSARQKRAAKIAHRKAVADANAAGRPAPVWTRAKENAHADEAGALERDASGALLFHPHAHCVVKLPCKMDKETWAEMLRFVWVHWGDHWDEGAVISDAREVCKYVCKPGEIAELEPKELCALEAALHGLRLVTPMGVLKKEIRARKDAGETLRRHRTPEGMVWRVAKDHNRGLSTSEEEKEFFRGKRRQDRLDYLDAKTPVVNPATGDVLRVGIGHTGAPKRKSALPLCRVMARLAPAAVASPLKEPRVVVMATRGAFRADVVASHPLTVKLWNQGIQAWEAGRAIRVHTGTSTGEQRTLTLLHETDERFAPATEPIWEASKPCQLIGRN